MIGSFESYQENEAWTWEHLALTRARIVSGPPAFAARVEKVIREVLCRPRDAETIAGDAVEMRTAIATEKGDSERWNLKYVAGGLIDLEFIAQYLQLVHAHEKPDILDTSTARALDKAARLGVLSADDADVLRPAVRLYQNLTQILRLCLPGPFDPKSAGPGLLSLLARAADVPDFATLEAHLKETQVRVRASFVRILGKACLGRRPQATASRGIGSSSIMEGVASTGSRTSTIVPVPSVERMRIAPPCNSVSDFAIARPRPEPPYLLVSWLSTCSNGLPRFFRASFGIPMPVSSMAMLT